MLAKWITCDVPERMRDRFAAAQQRWSVIGDQPGLVGQVGGWDSRTGRAHVLGLWADTDIASMSGHVLELEPEWRISRRR